MAGTLFLVSTPIGNLSDVSERALGVLGEVDICYAEDTRHTGRMLARLGVDVPLRSLHGHNEVARVREIVERLDRGERCALVSDAGTPAISDPGRAVVGAVHDAGFPVVPIPGPSAVTAAIAASGLSADRFLFLGFAPRRGSSRRDWLNQVADSSFTVVIFESPRRVQRLLEELSDAGLAERKCIVCRELTKLHEEILRGSVAQVGRQLDEERLRGEFTIVVEGGKVERETPPEAEARAAALAVAGEGTRQIASRLQAEFCLARNEAYRCALLAVQTAGESIDE
jgi:16S rRNA (cytidine1402-2'-O)-methyltransferase